MSCIKIGGFVPNSLIDYTDKVSYLVFTAGCNMDCFYCHNRQLINTNVSVIYLEDYVFNDIKKRIGFIDAVVITGGEPTLQDGLAVFIEKLKNLNLLVKLDTNGLRPEVIKDLLGRNLLDYIAMDIKAPIDKYSEICGCNVDINKIKYSIDIIENSQCEHEFRTTLAPQLGKDDIFKIIGMIKSSSKYVIQNYVPPKVVPDCYINFLHPPYTKDYVENLRLKVNKLRTSDRLNL